MGFYGQGYSISRFLVEMGGRPRFLAFVRDGSRTGWDAAARAHYGLAGVREVDRAWRSWHKVTLENRSQPGTARSTVAIRPTRRPEDSRSAWPARPTSVARRRRSRRPARVSLLSRNWRTACLHLATWSHLGPRACLSVRAGLATRCYLRSGTGLAARSHLDSRPGRAARTRL